MVQVRKSFPRNADGSLAVDQWIAQLTGFDSELDRNRLSAAVNAVEQAQALDPDVDEKGIRSNGKIGCFASGLEMARICLLYTSPSPRDREKSRMPSSA